MRSALALSETGSCQLMVPQPGDFIGQYKLLEKLGEGGLGVVYRAEQRDPITRLVAVKTIRVAMDDSQSISGLQMERNALGRLDHPNIARVLDGGATETGQPFFVMELVNGPRITDYCDRQCLSIRKRLELFIQVCHAVQHAHQKGIIHGDIKPSNILVAEQDGGPVAKLIDFGLATGLRDVLEGEVIVARHHSSVFGTPAYMSPEQAGNDTAEVDSRCDIYAAGALLYELLTSQTLFDGRDLLRGGFEQMRRLIREKEPLKPSVRLGLLGADNLGALALQRSTSPLRLIREIRGDLDCIVMKCLEKDRARRYESASGLALDVECHLNSEPVTAAAPGTLYRVGKLVRRHRVELAMAATLVLLLVVGVVVSTWQAVRATRAERQQALLRQQAQAAEQASRTDAATSRQVARFLTEMLDGVGPSVAMGRDTKMLHEILDRTAERIGKDLKNRPEVEAQLRNTLGTVYEELGDYSKAGDMLRQALALRKSVFGGKDRRVADSLHDLGGLLKDQGEPAEAESLFRQALALRRELFGNDYPEVASSLDALGVALSDQGKLRQAEEIHRQALALRKRLLGDEHVDVAVSLHNLGNVLLMEGKHPEAEALFRQVLAMRKTLLGSEHPLQATTLGNLGTALWYENKFSQAEAVYRETLAMHRKLMGNEHPDVATSLHNLACVLQAQGKFSEAEPLCKQALEMRRKLLGAEHPEYAATLSVLATVYEGQGRFVEAETTQREGLAIQRKRLGPEHPEAAVSLKNLGDILRLEGRFTEAETVQREALRLLKKALGGEHQLVAIAIDALGNVLRDEGKLAEAETSQREALALRRKVLASDHPDIAQSLNDLASVLRAQGHSEEAEPMYRGALEIRRKLLGNEHPDTIESLAGLAGSLQERGNLTDAERLTRECLSLCEKRLSGDWRIFDSQARLGSILLAQKRYADAEPLLLAGYDGLRQRQDRIPASSRRRLKETAGQLARLYDATSRPDRAAEWKKVG
jgi:serine/threonine protein kinase/tetratricopeptide (TPR) repeat protein